MTLFITGAAGFIGSSFLRVAKAHGIYGKIVIIDSLTYAGRKENFIDYVNDRDVIFENVDIRNYESLRSVFQKYEPSSVVHLAAESHVDNSISGPRVFIETNVIGTFNLLECSRELYSSRKVDVDKFKFVHVSTDEVFGELGETGKFSETTAYDPSSPYSASKASSDHLVRAWHRTFGLPCIVTNCSNNYGPRQFPEKLIPRMILNALADKALPVYGKGQNVRDWIYVDDHSEGIWLALTKGKAGDTYCLGGNSERKNIEVVTAICEILDRKKPRRNNQSYKELITFVEDRLGHDFRYAIDDQLAQEELGYKRRFSTFEEGLESTINWYLENSGWVESISKGAK
ncbi:dTDP-glucose 4,6-dehydratase [Pseudobdellovibrio exovorus]|uniref:dTDP-glucose 4,6-dehydratase n=1 Tax=Pseudobdellovibrio exovorus JSS TaxID=1184267 RepID=M4V8G8_9BACT|nr:dTDP-glucose 4,6-dehydratase [Pseudobdellovibrio exovorus]AGH95692.1 dTDP-glucose 4,6-dehydratase [Pseudobdellovibrio exovorus JSS]